MIRVVGLYLISVMKTNLIVFMAVFSDGNFKDHLQYRERLLYMVLFPTTG